MNKQFPNDRRNKRGYQENTLRYTNRMNNHSDDDCRRGFNPRNYNQRMNNYSDDDDCRRGCNPRNHNQRMNNYSDDDDCRRGCNPRNYNQRKYYSSRDYDREEYEYQKFLENKRNEEEDKPKHDTIKIMPFTLFEKDNPKPSLFKVEKPSAKDANIPNFMELLMTKILTGNKPEEDNSEQENDTDEFKIDINKEYDILDVKVDSITDLIKLGKLYDPVTCDKYSINLKQLNKLMVSLDELNSVIGMDSVKKSIVDQIIFFLQGFEKNKNMLHTVIQGPPGVGKTMLGFILGKIYYNMGVLKGSANAINSLTGKKNDFVFKVVRRSDLIGEYLGHTAIKTQRVIDECKGGVLFIDEAYSLGNNDKKDSFSKECIDTLNRNLSENKTKFLCIIAGYPDDLERCFFSQNTGLRRRFTFKYNIDKYTSQELSQIFIKMVKDDDWALAKEVYDNLSDFMNKNMEQFENFGGDMETLLLNCKISHAKRIFGKHPKERKIITIPDLTKGYETFLLNKKKNETNMLYQSMYS